jgi:hypothetical protein
VAFSSAEASPRFLPDVYQRHIDAGRRGVRLANVQYIRTNVRNERGGRYEAAPMRADSAKAHFIIPPASVGFLRLGINARSFEHRLTFSRVGAPGWKIPGLAAFRRDFRLPPDAPPPLTLYRATLEHTAVFMGIGIVMPATQNRGYTAPPMLICVMPLTE